MADQSNNIIQFLRKRDYQFVKELGHGACGKTVLLFDDLINEHFVCKKYSPIDESQRESLFRNFVQEIKLLHLLYHPNIVRVFTYYIYPTHLSGYFLMEFVEGQDIDDYLAEYPENINDVFLQTIDGFKYLEKNKILHRDIRPQNVLVTDNGRVKIIDFGFGKPIHDRKDFDKSITLNWWGTTPAEFQSGRYEFKTEVYFIGKLFESIIREREIEHFKFTNELEKMCKLSPQERTPSFFDVSKNIRTGEFLTIEFTDLDLGIYRSFSQGLFTVFSKIEKSAKYFDDIDKVLSKIEKLYKRVMLEEYLPSTTDIASCFVNGPYYFSKKARFSVADLKEFIDLLYSCSQEKRNIILSNLHSRLDAVVRYDADDDFDDDIPF